MSANHTDELAELAALFALDALDEPERTAAGEHIETCAICQAEVRSMQDTLVTVSSVEPIEPSPELRSSVLEAIEHTPQATPESDTDDQTGESAPRLQAVPKPDQPGDSSAGVPSAGRRSSLRRPGPLLAVAAAFVLIAGAVGVLLSGGDSVTRAEEIAAVADAATVDLASAVDTSSAEITFVFARSTNEGVLVATGLDALPEDKTYEFWLIGDSGARPAGLFRPGEDGTAELEVTEIDDAAVVGVTVEPAGGSDAPTGEVIFSSELT